MKRTALRRDSAQVRAWVQRSRQKAAQNAAERGPRQPLRAVAVPPVPAPPPEPEGPLTPAEWREAVWLLDAGVCVGCGRGPFDLAAGPWVWHAHHVVMKQKLRPGLKWDPRNGIVLCRRCHEDHHGGGGGRVPAGVLPVRCYEFARDVGEWAVVALEIAHP